MSTGCAEKIICLMEHSIACQSFSEYLKITRRYDSGIFFHFCKIRIHAALSGFVCNDRAVNIRFFFTVPVCRWFTFVYSYPSFFCHMRYIILIGGGVRTGGRCRVESAIVMLLSFLHQVFQNIKITFVFISVTH